MNVVEKMDGFYVKKKDVIPLLSGEEKLNIGRLYGGQRLSLYGLLD